MEIIPLFGCVKIYRTLMESKRKNLTLIQRRQIGGKESAFPTWACWVVDCQVRLQTASGQFTDDEDEDDHDGGLSVQNGQRQRSMLFHKIWGKGNEQMESLNKSSLSSSGCHGNTMSIWSYMNERKARMQTIWYSHQSFTIIFTFQRKHKIIPF